MPASVCATGVVTREDYDRFLGAVKVSEAQVQRSKEQIARLEVQLSHTRISAGTGGIVADRFAEPGDVATPGKAILSVYDPVDLELHANVPESLTANVAVGRKLQMQIDAAGLNSQGEVREIVPQAQQASRTVLVKVALPTSTGIPFCRGCLGELRFRPARAIDCSCHAPRFEPLDSSIWSMSSARTTH